jgi:hypothetical protein
MCLPLTSLLRGCIMASIRDFYKRKLLAAKDMKGKSVVGKITSVYPETPTGKDADGKTKIVIELDDGEHRIQLNKTNALDLAKQLGDDYEQWEGKKVKVTTIKTQFAGTPCDGLKVVKV